MGDLGHRKYSADEKKALIAKYDVRVGAGQSQNAACEELGVRRSTIMYWKAIVEAGGDLTDTDAGKGHGKGGASLGIPTRKRHEHEKADQKRKYAVVTVDQKIKAAQEHLSGKHTAYELAAKYGCHYTTIHSWSNQFKAGEFSKAGRPTQPPDPGTQIVTMRDPPTLRTNGSGPPVQLGLAIDQSEEVVLLRAENARLKAKIRQLLPLVMDSE